MHSAMGCVLVCCMGHSLGVSGPLYLLGIRWALLILYCALVFIGTGSSGIYCALVFIGTGCSLGRPGDRDEALAGSEAESRKNKKRACS